MTFFSTQLAGYPIFFWLAVIPFLGEEFVLVAHLARKGEMSLRMVNYIYLEVKQTPLRYLVNGGRDNFAVTGSGLAFKEETHLKN